MLAVCERKNNVRSVLACGALMPNAKLTVSSTSLDGSEDFALTQYVNVRYRTVPVPRRYVLPTPQGGEAVEISRQLPPALLRAGRSVPSPDPLLL